MATSTTASPPLITESGYTLLPPESVIRRRGRAAAAIATRTYSSTARLVLGAATVLVAFAAGGAATFVIGAGLVSGWHPAVVVIAALVGAVPLLITVSYRRTLRDAADLPHRAWHGGRAVAGPVLASELRRSALSAVAARSRNPLRAGRVLRRSATTLRGVLPGAGRLASLPYHLVALACLPIAGWMWFLGMTGVLAAVAR